jgi:hypothetical protein
LKLELKKNLHRCASSMKFKYLNGNKLFLGKKTCKNHEILLKQQNCRCTSPLHLVSSNSFCVYISGWQNKAKTRTCVCVCVCVCAFQKKYKKVPIIEKMLEKWIFRERKESRAAHVKLSTIFSPSIEFNLQPTATSFTISYFFLIYILAHTHMLSRVRLMKKSCTYEVNRKGIRGNHHRMSVCRIFV